MYSLYTTERVQIMKTIRIKINKQMHGYPPGFTARVPVDDNDVPLDKVWRDRLRDAEIDACVEIVDQKPSRKTPTKTKDNEKS